MKYLTLHFSWLLLACSNSDSGRVIQSEHQIDLQTEITVISEWDSIVCAECLYENLSNEFNYQLEYARYFKGNKWADSIPVTITVLNKRDGEIVDSVNVELTYDFDFAFRDCSQSGSYITDYKTTYENEGDNWYGEFRVADFNFDSREDFAIISDEGGTGGTNFYYYVQDETRKFKLDSFLTFHMVYFPVSFQKDKKILVSRSRGAYACENKYQYNLRKKEWSKISSVYLEEWIDF